MSTNLGLITGFLTTVIVVGLIVRFHQGSVGFTNAVFTGANKIVSSVENPGNLEQKVS